MTYQWKTGLFPVPAETAGKEIERLEGRHGAVTPRLVLEESRPKDAPLHPCFEWDDAKAAEKYRLQQSRQILCNLTVTVEREEAPPQTVRAFVNVAGEKKGAFISIMNAMSSEVHRETVLQRALNELEAFQRKYADLKELAAVFAAADAIKPAA